VVLDETPFYAESGGQDSDAGIIRGPSGAWTVTDVQSPVPGLIVHTLTLDAPLAVGEQVQAEVDAFHRRGSAQAHTATHVLHAALHELVGQGATQAGSYNRPGYLRFDFRAPQALGPALVAEIEQRCNAALRDDLAVTSSTMKLEDAMAMGAMSLFGEKYPPMVRVIVMGGAWSRELCGGTHVASSAQIGLIDILSEASIGAGTRRVEALVSTDAFAHLAAERALVSELSGLLHVPPDQVSDRVAKLIGELKAANKQIEDMRTAQLLAGAQTLVGQAKDVGGVAVVTSAQLGLTPDQARQLATQVRDRLGSRPGVVAIGGGESDKPALVVTTTASAREIGVKAGELVRIGTAELGGKGGGRDDMAQGGGTDGAGLPKALQAIEAAVRNGVA